MSADISNGSGGEIQITKEHLAQRIDSRRIPLDERRDFGLILDGMNRILRFGNPMICEEMGVVLKAALRISDAEIPFWYAVLFEEFEQRVLSLRAQQLRESTPSEISKVQQELVDRLPDLSNP